MLVSKAALLNCTGAADTYRLIIPSNRQIILTQKSVAHSRS